MLATGFSGHGFAMGPIAGRLVSELIVDGKPSLDITGVPVLALRRGRDRPAPQRPVTPRSAARRPGHAIALDVGGTFTDVALVDEASGRLWVTKTPTTPDDPSTGFIAGVDKALALAGADAASLRHVLHGTTTATNAILESKGAPTGLLTTAGFRYVLEIGRHDIPRRANMFAWVKPARPVPPELIFEIGGRVTVEGEELEPLDERAVREAARRLRAAGRRLGRRLLPARLRQRRPRAARQGRAARGASRLRGVAVQRGAAGLPRVRALDGHGAQRLRAAAGRPLRRPAGRAADGARDRRPAVHHEVQRRGHRRRRRAHAGDPHRAVGPRRRRRSAPGGSARRPGSPT